MSCAHGRHVLCALFFRLLRARTDAAACLRPMCGRAWLLALQRWSPRPNARGDAAAKKHYRILCARAEPRWRFCVAPWALPRNQKVSQQTKLGRVAESLRLTGKGFVKCFSTLSFFFSQVAYSPSPLQRRSPPSAKTYERSLTWSQRLRCLIRNRCHETVRRRSVFGWTATQPQRDASVLQSDAGAMSISPRWAIEPRC